MAFVIIGLVLLVFGVLIRAATWRSELRGYGSVRLQVPFLALALLLIGVGLVVMYMNRSFAGWQCAWLAPLVALLLFLWVVAMVLFRYWASGEEYYSHGILAVLFSVFCTTSGGVVFVLRPIALIAIELASALVADYKSLDSYNLLDAEKEIAKADRLFACGAHRLAISLLERHLKTAPLQEMLLARLVEYAERLHDKRRLLEHAVSLFQATRDKGTALRALALIQPLNPAQHATLASSVARRFPDETEPRCSAGAGRKGAVNA